mmetsp:Transcript_70812/g.134942  ORF Transcript_70812/g.134942 Transcript_70812/m.134942 type:complete len:761 (-) Transcript_70812:12-2294(-)
MVEPAGFKRSPLLEDPKTRFFVITSNVGENVVKSVEHNVWATQRKNEQKLNDAYRTCPAVILVFSVNKSGAFQGYARMRSFTGRATSRHDPFNGFGRLFDVEWLRLHDMEMSEVQHLRNALDDMRQVGFSRDGQELTHSVGCELCHLIDIRVFNEDPANYEPVADSQHPRRSPSPVSSPPATAQIERPLALPSPHTSGTSAQQSQPLLALPAPSPTVSPLGAASTAGAWTPPGYAPPGYAQPGMVSGQPPSIGNHQAPSPYGTAPPGYAGGPPLHGAPPNMPPGAAGGPPPGYYPPGTAPPGYYPPPSWALPPHVVYPGHRRRSRDRRRKRRHRSPTSSYYSESDVEPVVKKKKKKTKESKKKSKKKHKKHHHGEAPDFKNMSYEEYMVWWRRSHSSAQGPPEASPQAPAPQAPAPQASAPQAPAAAWPQPQPGPPPAGPPPSMALPARPGAPRAVLTPVGQLPAGPRPAALAQAGPPPAGPPPAGPPPAGLTPHAVQLAPDPRKLRIPSSWPVDGAAAAPKMQAASDSALAAIGTPKPLEQLLERQQARQEQARSMEDELESSSDYSEDEDGPAPPQLSAPAPQAVVAAQALPARQPVSQQSAPVPTLQAQGQQRPSVTTSQAAQASQQAAVSGSPSSDSDSEYSQSPSPAPMTVAAPASAAVQPSVQKPVAQAQAQQQVASATSTARPAQTGEAAGHKMNSATASLQRDVVSPGSPSSSSESGSEVESAWRRALAATLDDADDFIHRATTDCYGGVAD